MNYKLILFVLTIFCVSCKKQELGLHEKTLQDFKRTMPHLFLPIEEVIIEKEGNHKLKKVNYDSLEVKIDKNISNVEKSFYLILKYKNESLHIDNIFLDKNNELLRKIDNLLIKEIIFSQEAENSQSSLESKYYSVTEKLAVWDGTHPPKVYKFTDSSNAIYLLPGSTSTDVWMRVGNYGIHGIYEGKDLSLLKLLQTMKINSKNLESK